MKLFRRAPQRRVLFCGIAMALAGTTVGCGQTAHPSTMDHSGGATTAMSHPPTDHAGMDDKHGAAAMGDGLSATAGNLRFMPAVKVLPGTRAASYAFTIMTTDGRPVTAFQLDQTRLMHFYVIRSDLTGFQHIHPTMAGDGTWTAPLAALDPGSYRAYAAFIAQDTQGTAMPYVLSDQFTVAGSATVTPLPGPSATTSVDGFTLSLSGTSMTAAKEQSLTVTVSRAGQPVTDLQPYLETYAHLTAFHDGDMAFAHLHLKRPGFGGGSISVRRWSYGTTE